MTEHEIISLLSADAFWSVNKKLARTVGIDNAVFLAELLYKYQYWKERGELDNEGGFFFTSEDIQKLFNITHKPVARMTKQILDSGLVKIKKRGVPAKNYWYIQFDVIAKILSQPQMGMTGQPQSGLSSEPEMGSTSESQTGVTSTPQKGVAITKKSTKKSNLKNNTIPLSFDDSKLHTRIKEVIDEGYTKLTRKRISWTGRDITIHQNAIKSIIARLVGTYEQREEEFLARARTLYKLVAHDERTNGFWWKQQFLYATLDAYWNKIIPEKKPLGKKRENPQSWLESNEFTEVEKINALIEGIEQNNLLPEGWEAWESKLIQELTKRGKQSSEILEKYKKWETSARTKSATAAGT